MYDMNNVIEQAESSAIATKSLPTDNTKQAVKDGLEESSSNAKDYHQRRRNGMTDSDTGQMVKVGELPPKPEFYDSSVQKQEVSPAAVDAPRPFSLARNG